MENKKKKVLKVLGLVGLFVLVFGLSYALFRVTLTGLKKSRLTSANFNLELLDKNGSSIEKNNNNEYEYEINLDKAVPITDEEGLDQVGFEFKLKNSGDIPVLYTIYLDDVELSPGEARIDDSYIKYSLEKNNSIAYPEVLTYTLSNSRDELDYGLIKSGEIYSYTLKLWIDYDANNGAMNKVFDKVLKVEGVQQTKGFAANTFAGQIYNNNQVLNMRDVPNGFDSNKEDDGLYKYTDDDGTASYIFRGLDVNNYVTFANMTWRIIRIGEDGTVKLISEDPLDYIGSGNENIYNNFANVQYNLQDDNDIYNKYEDSNIERYVNEWYENVMKTYGNNIVINEYCSDRYENSENLLNQFVKQNYSFSTVYGIYNRGDLTNYLVTGDENSSTARPSISCVSGDKVYRKAALITADEYLLSGGGIKENHYLKSSYLENVEGGNYLWTMSPTGFGGVAKSFQFRGDGTIYFNSVTSLAFVRPVITLKSKTTSLSGNGTESNPYIIE